MKIIYENNVQYIDCSLNVLNISMRIHSSVHYRRKQLAGVIRNRYKACESVVH